MKNSSQKQSTDPSKLNHQFEQSNDNRQQASLPHRHAQNISHHTSNLNAKIILRASQLTQEIVVNDERLQILSDLSLKVYPSQTIAIIGASGSGKSTLLGLLAGLDRPSAGSIELCGYHLEKLDEDERALLRAQHVGFIFQNFQLINSLTAAENVMLPLELKEVDNASARAYEILTQVGLSNRLHQYPPYLSGGEQQRVAIARAFATYPNILFADEPTANLDRQTGMHIADLLFAMNEEYHTTLIIVTHDEYLAQRCKTQYELRNGKLVQL